MLAPPRDGKRHTRPCEEHGVAQGPWLRGMRAADPTAIGISEVSLCVTLCVTRGLATRRRCRPKAKPSGWHVLGQTLGTRGHHPRKIEISSCIVPEVR